MNKKCLLFTLFSAALMLGVENMHAQGFLNKLRDKAEDKAVKKVFGEDDKKTNSSSNSSTSGTSTSGTSSSTNNVQNTKGGGLDNSAPNVKENIKSAQDAFSSKNYSDARYAAKQAMMGVELEIGQNILKSLPDKVDGLSPVPDDDKVTSTGAGFAGLFITRNYQKDDKQFKVTVENNAVLLSSVNMYLDNTYTQTNGQNKDKVKRTKFKNYRAIIQYDENSGYTLSVPFGQSSVLVMQGINYANETALMTAANQIDIDKIKSELGEK